MAQRNTFRDDEDLEEKINMRDLARVGVYLKPYMARVVWILIVVAAMGCINVVEPYLTKIMIDSVIPAKNLALLGELVALLAVLIVIYEFGLRYRTVEITRVGQLMLKDMRRDLFTHIQTLPFSYFDSRPHGKILIRVVNYVNTLSDTLSSGLVNVISDVFTFFITLVVMFVVDWRLALYSLALFPLLIAWVLGLQHFQRRAYQVLSNKQSNLNAFIHESFFLENVTGAFNAGDVVDYLRKTNNSYLRNQLPNIERHFAALISRSDSNNNLPLLFNFYREVKTEIERRIDSDNQWFDAIISAEQSNSEVSVFGNAVQAESDSIEDKLSDLINMFVIHLRGDYDRNLCHAVLFAVISLEKDIRQNNRIRNRVLRPLVDALNSRTT